MKRMAWKLIAGVVIAAGLWAGSGVLGFPLVFQVMFVLYAALGLAIFLLLDAPSLPGFSGRSAVAGLIVFYVVISGVFVLGATALPQYDPDDEKTKSEKLLKARREKAAQEHGQLDELIQNAKRLEARVESLSARLNRLAPARSAEADQAARPVALPGAGSFVARGMEVYELHECYNCHKIGGKGSVKKRGPELDNIGAVLTKEDIKKKIFDPTYLYAEGFEKEHKKGVMPDKYKELMSEEELDALGAYLSTLKNGTVQTPRPVFVKTKVEHGFTVYGYVRDASGKPLAGVEVQAQPLKDHGHATKAKTNPEGYYEVFLHLHNEDTGTKVRVTAQGASKELVAQYDLNDKVTKRQASVDLQVPAI